MSKFFFITSYDMTSGTMLTDILNSHPDLLCNHSCVDILVKDTDHSNLTIDQLIGAQGAKKQFNGNCQRFSAFELQYKTLVEKTAQAYRKANVLLAPALRINFIIHSWKQLNLSTDQVVDLIEERIRKLENDDHDLFKLYSFHYFYHHILNTVIDHKLADINQTDTKLFILALAKLITFDCADMPVTGQKFNFENLVKDENSFIDFIGYLTDYKATFNNQVADQLRTKLIQTNKKIADISAQVWEPWQTTLLNDYLNIRLETIYYPHIDKPLVDYYAEAGYDVVNKNPNQIVYSKLISIQLNSNRPAQLAAYFDNIEETADNPEDIEVLVNIDSGSVPMKTLLDSEIPKRTFTLKYIETPRPKSFCDLWQPINKLLAITDSNSYFLLNISDEMFFTQKGWDSTLKKYVGFFPDHLFRLRASRNKFRNYFDRWECSFAQDSIPITTKKWIDVGGDWNPCFGPDSFQQLISFYLAKEGEFSNNQYLRELPILDIQFSGDVPALGISQEKRWKHISDHIYAMETCQSYKMQLEARRRAVLIKANIIANKNKLSEFQIKDLADKKQIQLITNNNVFAQFSYALNPIAIKFTNVWRRLFFANYFGDGKDKKVFFLKTFLQYLYLKYQFFYRLKCFLVWIRSTRRKVRDGIKARLKKNQRLWKVIKTLSFR